MKNTRAYNVAITKIEEHDDNFPYLAPRWQNDIEFVLEAVAIRGDVLEHVKPEFKDNEQVVHNAITAKINRSRGPGMKYASERLQNDFYFVNWAVQTDWRCFEHVSERLRDNREIARSAIGQFGYVLQHASERLQNDRELCRLAINTYPRAVEFVGVDCPDYQNLVMLVAKFTSTKNCDTWLYKKNLALLCVKCCVDAYNVLPESLKSDEEILALVS